MIRSQKQQIYGTPRSTEYATTFDAAFETDEFGDVTTTVIYKHKKTWKEEVITLRLWRNKDGYGEIIFGGLVLRAYPWSRSSNWRTYDRDLTQSERYLNSPISNFLEKI